MSYVDLMNADYYHLMEVLSTKEKKEETVVDLATFVKSLS